VSLDGRVVSTLDLTGREFVLIAGPDGGAWVAAGRALCRRGMPLTAYRLGVDLTGDIVSVLAGSGLGRDGALLVRPDGFIAWRCRGSVADPAGVLDAALSRALCRGDAVAREDAA
jgi:hypothetical protein